MDIRNKHIALVVYGIVDERSKKSARALAGAGAQVTIVSITHTRANHEGEPFSVRYVDPGLPKGSTLSWRPARIAVNIANRILKKSEERRAGLFGINNALSALRELQLDIIHAINADTLETAAQAATELGIPFVYEAYEFWPDHARSTEVKHATATREALLGAESSHIADAAAIITVSPFLAKEYQETYGLDTQPVAIFNAPPTIAQSVSPVHDPLRVLFLGNLQPERNIQMLLDAAAQVENIVVTFQGSGVMAPEILAFARTHNAENRILVRKPVAYVDIAESASSHDVGIICHKAYDRQMQGALPNKFFEYLSGGLAVIATDSIAFREFPGFEEFGRYLDTQNTEALVPLLKNLASNPEKVAQYKAASYKAAQLYCGDAQAGVLVSIYGTISAQSGSNKGAIEAPKSDMEAVQ